MKRKPFVDLGTRRMLCRTCDVRQELLTALKAMLAEFGSYQSDNEDEPPACLAQARKAVAAAEHP